METTELVQLVCDPLVLIIITIKYA